MGLAQHSSAKNSLFPWAKTKPFLLKSQKYAAGRESLLLLLILCTHKLHCSIYTVRRESGLVPCVMIKNKQQLTGHLFFQMEQKMKHIQVALLVNWETGFLRPDSNSVNHLDYSHEKNSKPPKF